MRYSSVFLCAIGLTSSTLLGCVEEMKGSSADEAATTSSMTAQLYSPGPDEVTEDPDTGLSIAKEIIYITFRRQTSPTTAREIIASAGGVIVGQDPASHLYQARFAGKELKVIDGIRMKLLADNPEVEVASRLSVTVHKDPYYVR